MKHNNFYTPTVIQNRKPKKWTPIQGDDINPWHQNTGRRISHYSDDIMGAMASEITSLTIVYSIVNSGGVQRKHQSSASLAFVRGIHRRPVNSPHKWPVTRNKFPFDDVIMLLNLLIILNSSPRIYASVNRVSIGSDPGVQIMVVAYSAPIKPLYQQMLGYCQWDP